MANYQVTQDSLLKNRFFYEFLTLHDKSIARECLTTNVKNDEKLDSMKSHVSISFFLFSCLARFVKCLKYRLGSSKETECLPNIQ